MNQYNSIYDVIYIYISKNTKFITVIKITKKCIAMTASVCFLAGSCFIKTEKITLTHIT